MLHWLVQEGLIRDLISAIVFLTVTTLAGALPWKRHKTRQEHLIDLLDTATPGGITDLLQALQENALEDTRKEANGASAHPRPKGR